MLQIHCHASLLKEISIASVPHLDCTLHSQNCTDRAAIHSALPSEYPITRFREQLFDVTLLYLWFMLLQQWDYV